MHVLITGAAGMLGRKLAERLVADGTLGGRPVLKLTLQDLQTPPSFGSEETAVLPVAGDIADHVLVEHVMAEKPDVIFHLAALASAGAEADMEKGYRANLDGTRGLFEAVRKANYAPRLIFASTVAVYGAPLPDVIDDDFALTPLTSYGTAKAMGELLLGDYTRRGFFDGVALRLPTICVRPGEPNTAASGFFSSIIREPLAGKPAILPVGEDLRHVFASPRAATGFFLHAATMETEALGTRRSLVMPSVSATVGEEIEALREVAGEKAVALIRREPNEEIARIVSAWPRAFEAKRARDLGFEAETSFGDIVAAHIEDEHGGTPPINA
ncbi:D-erythronate dehydrogenase [Afifella sp. IM 167]|uniref:D-erythronate dehydrogenase n=1 Tax=Afifella sp. IM 167 TaxID=2033586 RepID=UPI001CCE77A8|nr:D-erythronate dehydrogenase [Afifella sp. IM 167]MBZ8132865.1 NAD-dependent epimerase [Afifella sp. IM 167]